MPKTEDYLDNLLDSITQVENDTNRGSRGAESARARRHERRSRVRPDDDFMEASGLNEYRRNQRRLKRNGRSERERSEDDFLRSFEYELSGEDEDDFLASFERELRGEAYDMAKAAEAAEDDDFAFHAPQEEKKTSVADNILANIAGIVSEAKKVAQGEGEDRDQFIEEALAAGGPSASTEGLDLSAEEPSLAGGGEPALSDEVPEDMDLMDMLAGEGEGDLSDIGELLSSDENQEELSEARESFDEAAESVAEGGEGAEATEGGSAGGVSPEGAEGEEEAKPNIIQKLLGAITGIFKKKEGEEDGEADEEDEDEDEEEDAEGEGGETKEEKKARLKKEKEEAKKKKKEEADAKKKAKEEEKKKKAEEKKKKAAEKKAKPKKKKPGKPKERSPKVPIPVLIVFVLFSMSIIGASKLMSGVLGDMMMMSSAQKAYDEQDYLKSYQTLAGRDDLDKEGARLRNKAKMMAYLQTKYDEYVICMDSGKQTNSGLSRYTIRTNYQLALDSLIQGAYYYQKNEAKAKKLDITAEYDEYGDRLINELNQTFHVSLGEAVDLYHNNTRKNYTAALQKIVYAAGFKDSY